MDFLVIVNLFSKIIQKFLFDYRFKLAHIFREIGLLVC